MRNSKALPHKQIIQRLSGHGIKTKHDSNGRLLALDCSTYNGRLVCVWTDAPMTVNSINSFLGY